jgi:hypothetical protein
MTRTQIRQLMQNRQADTTPDSTSMDLSGATKMPTRPAPANASENQPVLPPEIPQVFLPQQQSFAGDSRVYEPAIVGSARVHYTDSRKGVSAIESLVLLASLEPGDKQVEWSRSQAITLSDDALQTAAQQPCRFAEIPAAATKQKNFGLWEKSLADYLYRTRRFELLLIPSLGVTSKPGESERDFRIRVAQLSREERDRQLEMLRQKHSARLRSAQDRVRRAEEAVDRETQESSSAKFDSAISLGASILGAVLGRKKLGSTSIGRAATAARGMGRAAKSADDVRRAQGRLADSQQRLRELEDDLADEARQLRDRFDASMDAFQTVQIKPRKSDIEVRLVALAWVPVQAAQQ